MTQLEHVMALVAVGCGVALGCGGSTDVPRPAPAGEPPPPGYLTAPSERATGGINCTERTDIVLESIENFELGAAGGWYLSNDVCSDCQDIINQADAIRNAGQAVTQADRLAELDADLDACSVRCLDVLDTPYYFDNPPVAEAIEGGRCGSSYAMHIKGGPFIEWGGNMGFGFAPPLNASDVTVLDPDTLAERPGEGFKGISFWARLGETGGNNTLRLEVGEKHTDQNYPGLDGGPICTPNTTEANSEYGCDKFGFTALLRSDWQQFLVPFAEMRQQGWGMRAEYFDLTSLMSFSIFYPQGTWDFWIDDLAFYR
jgi:hypothetical protein